MKDMLIALAVSLFATALLTLSLLAAWRLTFGAADRAVERYERELSKVLSTERR